MQSKKQNEITPLRSFLTQEIIPGMQSVLFGEMTDFIRFAIATRGTKWYGKTVKGLKPLVSNQMKKRGGDGDGRTQSISNYYDHYKLIVTERVKQLGVDEIQIKSIIDLFDIAFRRHEKGEVAMDGIGDLKKLIITSSDIDHIAVCLKAFGGKSSLDEIICWLKNIKR